MAKLSKIITATIDKTPNGKFADLVTFSETMKPLDISVYSTISRRFNEIYPENTGYRIEKIAIEITQENDTTGNEIVLTRFYI